jgi:hypothetical protein
LKNLAVGSRNPSTSIPGGKKKIYLKNFPPLHCGTEKGIKEAERKPL